MRSFEQRAGAIVCDEPLYAHYLKVTGLDHPISAEIVERHEHDQEKVIDWLTAPLPEGVSLFYQKHMAHHLIPEVGRGWLEDVTHAFLIREPREMLTSLMKIIPVPRTVDTGLPQQVQLFDELREQGQAPPVIDSKDVLDDPRGVLASLCAQLGLEFEESMLSGPPGLRETDGCWAPHWYSSVETTTSFGSYRPKSDVVPEELQAVLAECEELYTRLAAHRVPAAS